jgi:protein ImuA
LPLRVPVAAPETIASSLAPPLRTASGAIQGSNASVQAAVIERLRSRILSLERHAPRRGPAAIPETKDQGLAARKRPPWELGCDAGDALLPGGLETNAVHEIKGAPSVAGGASASDWMTGIGFAARLAVRRTDALSAMKSANRPWVLWCWPKAIAGELGSPSLTGFAYLGLDPACLIIVETARAAEALNAIEESLKGASLAVVIGVLDEVDLMPARRLSLAAGEMATPCLIVTHPASEPAGATATRWRIKRLPSALHRFDPRAPGLSRFEVALERCRARPASVARPPFILEWSDETRGFGLASVMADLPAETRRARSGADAPTLRTY